MKISISLIYYSLLCLKIVECSLISQSTIEQCSESGNSEPQGGNGKTCSRKIVVSMALRSGQAETEALYANVNSVYDTETGENGILKQPFRIEISKDLVVANYRVYYRGSANAHPKEHIIVSSTLRCIDEYYSDETTCGLYTDINGKIVFNSQGFCCHCGDDGRVGGYFLRRSFAGCFGSKGVTFSETKELLDFKSTAHCMNFSKLWYDVYEIESPNVHYIITVKLLTLRAVRDTTKNNIVTGYNWTVVSNFTLSPDKPSGRSPDGTVIAKIQGDLLGSKGLMDLSAKRLLIPSLRTWYEDYLPKEYINGPSDWLLVDEHLVDLSGKECNKVGVYFDAFRFQPSKCFQKPFSCFSNQPSLFWRADNDRRSNGIKGFYMLHNYGRLHPSTQVDNSSFIMRLIYPNLHNSFVTFNIDASDVSFVINVGRGRIISADSHGFNKSTATTGEVVVVIENTGELTQDYNVALTECFGRDNLPSRKVTVFPGETESVTFLLLAGNIKAITTNCEVQLFDQQFSLLGTARLTFSVEAPCFCFGICDCTCDEKTGKVTEKECPTPPPIYIDTANLATRLLLFGLNFIGLHTIVGFFGVILITLGMVRLVCGGVLFCRKSKAQQHFDDMRKKTGGMKQATLVKCSGECRGALAAKARVKRKVERLRKMGKDPHRLDDWANTSFECTCNSEVADIRCIAIIKALCFFYYLLILPFIWLGKIIWWGIFKDTVDKKKAAEVSALKAARKKSPHQLEKLGVVSIRQELLKAEKERDKFDKKKEEINKQKDEDRKKKELKEEEKKQKEMKKSELDSRKPDENNTIDVIVDIEDIWEDELPDDDDDGMDTRANESAKPIQRDENTDASAIKTDKKKKKKGSTKEDKMKKTDRKRQKKKPKKFTTQAEVHIDMQGADETYYDINTVEYQEGSASREKDPDIKISREGITRDEIEHLGECSYESSDENIADVDEDTLRHHHQEGDYESGYILETPAAVEEELIVDENADRSKTRTRTVKRKK